MTDDAFFNTIRHLKNMIREQDRRIDDLEQQIKDVHYELMMNELMDNVEEKDNHWIQEKIYHPLSDAQVIDYRCSSCGLHFDCVSSYCPGCGAQMNLKHFIDEE